MSARPVSSPESGAGRWRGLDAFRGLAVIGMILVNNPGDHDAVYAPLAHSAWHGCTVADLVFPFFLFVVGITTTLSLDAARRRGDSPGTAHIWRRAGILFAIGLALNWFPFYQSGNVPWTAHPGPLDRIAERLLLLRIPGVMQRIAVTYLVAALIARRASSRAIVATAAFLLIGYWLLLTVAPVPGEAATGAMVIDQPARTIVAHVDRALFDWSSWGLGNHLWDSALTWDPEGALSTIPAVATVLLGVLWARWTCRHDRPRLGPQLNAGIALVAAGALWALVFPLNKALWTSSYVLFTAGFAAVTCAVCAHLLARRPGARWALPLVAFGQNPLVAYVGSELARRILHSSIKVPGPSGRLGIDEWVDHALHGVGLSAEAASLGWALLFLVAWFFALRRLSRRQLFVRV